MKAITLWQPWASLWAAGIKKNETRSWATKHRGPLVVHAAMLTASQLKRLIGAPEYVQLAYTCEQLGVSIVNLPRGCIVGVVEVEDCGHILGGDRGPFVQGSGGACKVVSHVEASLGYYSTGRYAWIGAHHRAFEPIPCRGGQRLWNVPPGVLGFDWTCPGCGTQNPSSNTHCSCELQYDRGMVDP